MTRSPHTKLWNNFHLIENSENANSAETITPRSNKFHRISCIENKENLAQVAHICPFHSPVSVSDISFLCSRENDGVREQTTDSRKFAKRWDCSFATNKHKIWNNE